jgi:hypothetical protein
MSIGFGVRAAMAEKELSEINRVLRQAGLPPYQEPEVDPTPDIYTIFRGYRCLGRAQFDHDSASSFGRLARLAQEHLGAEAKMLPLLLLGQPLYFLPISFTEPLYLDHGHHPRQPLCSSQKTTSELAALAKHISIPLEGSLLSDATAQALNMRPDEPQSVWLTMFEAARQSVAHKCALVLG